MAWVILLLALLAWPGESEAAIARVGSPATCNTNTTTCTVTLSPTTGNFVACWITYAHATNTVQGVADNGGAGGSTYTAAFNDAAFSSNYATALFYTMSAAASVTTITITVANAGGLAGICQEYSGVATSSALDVASTRATGASNTQTSNAVTPTAGIEALVLGYSFQNTSTADFTAAGSMSLLTNHDEIFVGTNMAAFDRIVATTSGNYTHDSTTGGVVGWAAYVAVFKAAAGGAAETFGFYKRRPK